MTLKHKFTVKKMISLYQDHQNQLGYMAMYDDLSLLDVEYVVDKNQTLSPGGTFYGNAEVADFNDDGERDGNREIENDDMILESAEWNMKKSIIILVDLIEYFTCILTRMVALTTSLNCILLHNQTRDGEDLLMLYSRN